MRRVLLALAIVVGFLAGTIVPAHAVTRTPVAPSWYITDARCVWDGMQYLTLGAYVNVVQVAGLNVRLDGTLVVYAGGSATLPLSTGRHVFGYAALPGYVVVGVKRVPFTIDPAPYPCGPA